MQVSALRIRYQSALNRATRHGPRSQTTKQHHGKTSAEDDARLDAVLSVARGGARHVDVTPSNEARLEHAVGYSRQRILGGLPTSSSEGLRHLAGLSQADEARLQNRIRQMQQALATMNQLQLRALQTGPIYA
ncbi:MAG: hypothetical protein VX589_16375 [Myxococcota bacterium]|nr:hypothetical protein [Myxococcota bacterium]